MVRIIVQVISAALGLQLAASAAATELIVSAASSLTNVFTEIGREFQRAHPQTKVLFNFGGSGQLLQQISKGAPVDVFASADQETMNQAQARGLIENDSRFDFAANALVVVTPIASAGGLTALNGLTQSAYRRIAIGNPQSVPAGRYSKAALQAAGVWEALRAKLVNTQNVRQGLDYVARGEVDAAFVYRTDVALRADAVQVALEVPTTAPILYPVAAIKGSASPSEAKQFVAFVGSKSSRAILLKYGFGAP